MLKSKPGRWYLFMLLNADALSVSPRTLFKTLFMLTLSWLNKSRAHVIEHSFVVTPPTLGRHLFAASKICLRS